MRPQTALIVALLLLAAVLAGCHEPAADPGDDPVDPGGDPEPGLPLEALTECRGTYPMSDEAMRCENEITLLAAALTPPADSWVCVAETLVNADHGARLYWNASAAQHVLVYAAPVLGRDAGGVLAVSHDNETTYANWNHAPFGASVPLPALPDGATLHLFLFTNYYQTGVKALANGTMRVDWSLHDGHAFPTRVIETTDAEYLLPYVAMPPADPPFPYRWGIAMDLGPPEFDFRVRVINEELLDVRLDVADAKDPGC